MYMINANPSYKPEPYKGEGFQELVGATLIPFMKFPKWVKDNSCAVLTSREVDTEGNSADTINIQMVYKGIVGERTVGLIIGPILHPLRAFAVTDEDAYQSLLQQLQYNKGFLNEQMEGIGKVFTNNDAQSVYAWTSQFFDFDKHLSKVVRTVSVSRTKAKTFTKGTKAEVMSEKEAIALVKEVAKRYNLYNVDVTFGKFNGKILGWCKTSDDNITPLSRPVGLEIFYADLLYKSTVLHELAHGIEFFKTGVSGHGKGFRSIFRLLLRQYHGVDPIGL